MKTIEYTGGTARVTTCAGHERTWSTGEAVTVSDEEAAALLALPGFIDKATTPPPDYGSGPPQTTQTLSPAALPASEERMAFIKDLLRDEPDLLARLMAAPAAHDPHDPASPKETVPQPNAPPDEPMGAEPTAPADPPAAQDTPAPDMSTPPTEETPS